MEVIFKILGSGTFWGLAIGLAVYLLRAFFPGIPYEDSQLVAWLTTAVFAILAGFGIVVDVQAFKANKRQEALLKAMKK
jgi:hypothetical protein